MWAGDGIGDHWVWEVCVAFFPGSSHRPTSTVDRGAGAGWPGLATIIVSAVQLCSSSWLCLHPLFLCPKGIVPREKSEVPYGGVVTRDLGHSNHCSTLETPSSDPHIEPVTGLIS